MFLEVHPSTELFAFYDKIDASEGKMKFEIPFNEEEELFESRRANNILQNILGNEARDPSLDPIEVHNSRREYDPDFRGFLYTDKECLPPNYDRVIECVNVSIDLDFYWYCGKLIVGERLLQVLEQFDVPMYKRRARVFLDGKERHDFSYFEIKLRAFRPAFDYHRSGDLIARRQMNDDAVAGRHRPMPIHLFGHVVWNPPCEIKEALFREAYSNRMLVSRSFAKHIIDAGIRGMAFAELRTD